MYHDPRMNRPELYVRRPPTREPHHSHDSRHSPVTYRPTRGMLRWVGVTIILAVALAAGLAWSDTAASSMLSNWHAAGFTSAPPTTADPDVLLEYAAANDIACTSVGALLQPTPACARMLEFRADYAAAQDRSAVLLSGLVVTLALVVYTFMGFTHRSSMNLRALGAEGQFFSPGWAVGWFFVPLYNLWRPWQVYTEMFKASLPGGASGPPSRWKENPAPAIVGVWWLVMLAALIFNPVVVSRVLSGSTLDDLALLFRTLALSDIFLAAPLVLTLVLAATLSRMQERQFQDQLREESAARPRARAAAGR